MGNEIGMRIRTLREKYGISQVELAQKTNISKQTLYKYEKGIVTNIPVCIIESIASTLCSNPAYIMGWIESEILECTDYKMKVSPRENELLSAFRKLNDRVQDMAIDHTKWLASYDENKKGLFQSVGGEVIAVNE